jgi:ankyrin repeat protein
MNARGQLPLHNAAQKGLLLNVQQLLEAGADLHAKSITGLTPLLSAAGHPEVVEWLLSVGANLLDVNNHGENLLMRAASKGEVFQDVLDIVLKQNPSAIDRLLSQESKDGDSMMHIMSKNGAMGSPHLSFFLSSPLGLSLINSRNTRGETPLMVACSAQSAVSLRPLIDAGADLNAQDNKGFTALMHAMEADAKGAFEELLMRGANPMLPNRYGKNLLDMAIDQNKPDFLPHLLSLGVPLSTDLRFMREDKKKRMPHFAGESPVVSAIRTSSPAFLQFHLKQTDPDDVDLLAGQRHVKRSKDRAEMSAVLNSHIAQKSMDSVVHKTGLLP